MPSAPGVRQTDESSVRTPSSSAPATTGLAAAAYLARGGLRACVLVRRDVLGGACVTEEVWPGYRVSRASYVVSMLQPKVVADLRLRDHGYAPIPLDPAYATYSGGVPVFFHDDPARAAASIARRSRRDADAYPGFAAMLERAAGFVRPLLLRPPPGGTLDQLSSRLRVAPAAADHRAMRSADPNLDQLRAVLDAALTGRATLGPNDVRRLISSWELMRRALADAPPPQLAIDSHELPHTIWYRGDRRHALDALADGTMLESIDAAPAGSTETEEIRRDHRTRVEAARALARSWEAAHGPLPPTGTAPAAPKPSRRR